MRAGEGMLGCPKVAHGVSLPGPSQTLGARAKRAHRGHPRVCGTRFGKLDTGASSGAERPLLGLRRGQYICSGCPMPKPVRPARAERATGHENPPLKRQTTTLMRKSTTTGPLVDGSAQAGLQHGGPGTRTSALTTRARPAIEPSRVVVCCIIINVQG